MSIKRCFKNLISLALAIVLVTSQALAAGKEEKTYSTEVDGTIYIDACITSGTEVVLESEDVTIDFTDIDNPDADDNYALYKAQYKLFNSGSSEVTIRFLKPEILRVKSVKLLDSEAESVKFLDKTTLMVDDKEVIGRIYAGDLVEDIVNKSNYSNKKDTFMHYNYDTFFMEALFAFGGDIDKYLAYKYDNMLVEQPDLYYYEHDGGEERLCAKVFEIKIPAGESVIINNTQKVKGQLSRPTKYSEKGGVYEFAYNIGGLKSFYSLGEMTFSLAPSEALPILDCDTARYLDNDVWTIKSKALARNFTLTLGNPLTEKEVADINKVHGRTNDIINYSSIVGYVFVIIAFLSSGLIIYRRRKSGIHKITN